jgi:hypothetical protein
MHRFERYMRKYEEYPAFSRGDIRVTIAPGYIAVHRKFMVIFIPRRVLIPLLKWLIPLVREMDTSFDPETATEHYIEQESEFRRELRRQKKEAKRVKIREGR